MYFVYSGRQAHASVSLWQITEKKIKKPYEKQANVVLPVSPKVGLETVALSLTFMKLFLESGDK